MRVKNLFIPKGDVLKIVKNMLHSISLSDKEAEEVLQLRQVAFEQNLFVFNSTDCKQTSGLAMGNPLLPLLAEERQHHSGGSTLDSLEDLYVS